MKIKGKKQTTNVGNERRDSTPVLISHHEVTVSHVFSRALILPSPPVPTTPTTSPGRRVEKREGRRRADGPAQTVQPFHLDGLVQPLLILTTAFPGETMETPWINRLVQGHRASEGQSKNLVFCHPTPRCLVPLPG